MVQAIEREAEQFTNRKKADQRARELSRTMYGLVVLAVFRQERWDVIERYAGGAVTLYR